MCYVSYVFFNIKYSFVFIIADLHFFYIEKICMAVVSLTCLFDYWCDFVFMELFKVAAT